MRLRPQASFSACDCGSGAQATISVCLAHFIAAFQSGFPLRLSGNSNLSKGLATVKVTRHDIWNCTQVKGNTLADEVGKYVAGEGWSSKFVSNWLSFSLLPPVSVLKDMEVQLLWCGQQMLIFPFWASENCSPGPNNLNQSCLSLWDITWNIWQYFLHNSSTLVLVYIQLLLDSCPICAGSNSMLQESALHCRTHWFLLTFRFRSRKRSHTTKSHNIVVNIWTPLVNNTPKICWFIISVSTTGNVNRLMQYIQYKMQYDMQCYSDSFSLFFLLRSTEWLEGLQPLFGRKRNPIKLWMWKTCKLYSTRCT